MSEPFAYDVFLSHSSKDKAAVRALAERLRRDGLRVWLDEWVIGIGDSIPMKLEHGLRDARVLLLMMSADFFASEWGTFERHTFLFRDPTNQKRRFAPILLDNCDIPDTLRQFLYLDWRTPDDAVYQRLLAFCRSAQAADSGRENSPPASVGVASGNSGVAQLTPGVAREGSGVAPGTSGVAQPILGVAPSGLEVASGSVGVDQSNSGVASGNPGVEEYVSKVKKKGNSVEIDTENNCLILRGHNKGVWAIALSADGQTLVSGSHDNTLKVWDMKTGQCRATLEGHTSSVRAVALSADGQTLVSGSNDNTLKVWDTRTGQCCVTLREHIQSVCAVAISSDGQTLVSGSDDDTLKVWDMKTRQCRATLKGHTSNVYAVAISSDGQTLVSGSDDDTLKVWDMKTRQCRATLKGHTSNVYAVAISSDGQTLVSGSDDNTLKVWDMKTGQCRTTLEGHTYRVRAVAITPDGQTLVSGSWDYTLKVWDMTTGQCRATLEGHTSSVRAVALSADGQTLVSGSNDNTLRIWNLEDILASGKAMSEEATTRYTNVKVLLVGDSGVGKSGLALRLTENRFEATISTHGAWATHMKLPDADVKAANAGADVEREVWLWDFGGQSDYRLIHQLFMDETALAVVVFDPQEDNLFEGIGQWERDMARASRRPFPRILVAGRTDRGGLRISKENMEAFYRDKGFAEYIETSAETGMNCPELREAILRHIDWTNISTTSSPRIFKRIKEEILALRDSGKVLLRGSELQQHLEITLAEEKFTPEQFRAVVGLLSGPGLVWNLDFGDFVLLRPEWINAYAGAMVRTVRAYPDELGCIEEDTLLSGTLDYQDMKRIEGDDERFVLLALHETLLKQNLCIRVPGKDGNLLVFPAYFRRERPEQTEHPAAITTYRFSGMLEEIYTTLVVRLHHTTQFEKDELWRNAADFKSVTGKRVGLKLTRLTEGSGEITVYSDPALSIETKVAFLLYVHEHILDRADDAARTRHYVCTHCGTPVTNHETVAKRLLRGDKDISCADCEKRISLLDEIEERFASEEMHDKVRAMQTESQIVLDNQSRERILVGEVTARVSEAGQIFRETPHSDWGIDGEIEFKNLKGQATGTRVYVQLKSGDSYLRYRKSDAAEVFDIPKDRHINYWQAQGADVYLVIRDSKGTVRWMNITAALKNQTTPSKQVIFKGEPFTAESVFDLRSRQLGIAQP